MVYTHMHRRLAASCPPQQNVNAATTLNPGGTLSSTAAKQKGDPNVEKRPDRKQTAMEFWAWGLVLGLGFRV